MKKYLFLLVSLFFAVSGFAQIGDPVSWSFSSKKLNATTFEIRLEASLENGWHTYSRHTPEGGPVPTVVSFVKNPLVVLSGAVREDGRLVQRFEPAFDVEVKEYSGKVAFVQMVTVKKGVKTSLRGSVEYMVCNDHECLPPVTKSFTIELK